MSEEPIRAFIAVNIPSTCIDILGSLISRLKQSPAKVKWVRPESIHITLKFLGNISEDDIDKIDRVLAEQIAEEPAFEVTIRGTGGFPNLRRPRVLWSGIDDPDKRLKSLAKIVDRNLAKAGFPREKRAYSPHLTLGRVKTYKYIEDINKRMEAEKEFEGGVVEVSEVFLMRSQLKPSGAIYSALKSFPLNKT